MKIWLSGLTTLMTMGAATVSLSAAPLVDTQVDAVQAIALDDTTSPNRHQVLPRREIVDLVYESGFAEIEDIRLRRDRYVVTAVQPTGAAFRLALDAYDGGVIANERIGWSRGDRQAGDARRHGEPRGIEFRFDGKG